MILRRYLSTLKVFGYRQLFVFKTVHTPCLGSATALKFNFWRFIRRMPARNFPPAGRTYPEEVRSLADCYIFPWANGLHDQHGNPIAGSYLERGPERQIDYPFGAPQRLTKSQLAEKTESRNTVVFLPYSDLSHFGHLLTEGVAWMWPFLSDEIQRELEGDADWKVVLADRAYRRKVRFDPATSPPTADMAIPVAPAYRPENLPSISRLTELPVDRFLHVSTLPGPMKCKKVLLPYPSMINRRSISKHHFAHVQTAVDRFYCISQEDKTECLQQANRKDTIDKVYLSRSKLPGDLRWVHEEPELEKHLIERGWKIVYPELLPVSQQLKILAGARVLAGEAGSAFHLLMYFGHQFERKTVITMGVHDLNQDQRVLNIINQLRMQPVQHCYLACLQRDVRRGVADRSFLRSPRTIARHLEKIASGPNAS
jgi:hypothetical protein